MSSYPTAKVPKMGKEKTEMCFFIKNQVTCPYKKDCKFAHTAQELKVLRYLDVCNSLDEASLFRCHPCFTFVSTGACPYRNRCEFIHDARIGGGIEPVMQVKPCGKEMENPALMHILNLLDKKK